MSCAGELLPVTCLVCGPGVSLCHVQVSCQLSCLWTRCVSVSCAGELSVVCGPGVSFCHVQVSCCLSPVLSVDQVCLCVMCR